MTHKRPDEPIAPANIPGQRVDPKITPEEPSGTDEALTESDAERQARESEKAFDQAITRIPPG